MQRILLIVTLISVLTASLHARTWTANGHTLDGDFVKLEDETCLSNCRTENKQKSNSPYCPKQTKSSFKTNSKKKDNPFKIVEPEKDSPFKINESKDSGRANAEKRVESGRNDALGKETNPDKPVQTAIPKTLSFTPFEIRDPQLNNELAMTVALPDGWKVKESGVQWNTAAYNEPALIAFTLTGPTDEAAVMYTSKLSFHWDDVYPLLEKQLGRKIEKTIDMGNISIKPMKPEEFIRWMLQSANDVSDIQIKTVERPKLIVEQLKKAEPELTKQLQEIIRATQSNVPFKKLTFDTALTTFTCVKDRKRYEQQVCVVIQYLHLASPAAAFGIGGANNESIYWTVTPIYSAYALDGKLKKYESELSLITGNSAVNPVWDNKVLAFKQQIGQEIAKQQLQNIQDQQEHQRRMQSATQDTFNYISKQRQETFRNRSDAMSRVSQGWTDVITETDRWQDNSGRISAAPSGYNYGFINNSTGSRTFSQQPMSAPPGYTPMKKTPWAF